MKFLVQLFFKFSAQKFSNPLSAILLKMEILAFFSRPFRHPPALLSYAIAIALW